jgi:hypothetical protein
MDVKDVYGRPDTINMEKIRTAIKYSSEVYIILKQGPDRRVVVNKPAISQQIRKKKTI